VPLVPARAQALADLFGQLSDGRNRFFHPHPFTPAEASRLCTYDGNDYYCVLVDRADRALGYGYLRGWDEGYQEPSLGVAIHPEFRGRGLAQFLMERLHDVAWSRGASVIRLRVHDSNDTAKRLYTRLGYVFVGHELGELLGRLSSTMEGR
jgi:ribosomal-protein-alanine N-acetyltransferase